MDPELRLLYLYMLKYDHTVSRIDRQPNRYWIWTKYAYGKCCGQGLCVLIGQGGLNDGL
jgi:hypothetical protein